MLRLNDLKKDYYVGTQTIKALKGINLSFRRNEFVSILGPSGCGKTTLLNIIGGLDQYTSGDLLIDGKSTKTYKDTDWDSYRNSTIGFVFQNYNLISHLSVLDNVEMALSLSGVPQKERKERATKVLEQVGLKDYLNNRPNQLSGGQMQRVAIARALVNNPKVLLADEPTGALDSKTSKQIMELIQEISKDRLVIMVTHNSKIASNYSDRIINLLDGEVIGDTNPVEGDLEKNETLVTTKTSMSYDQAIRTSFKNLFTKKGRTFITAIAGSIGIIGVALVLGISTGMQNYIDDFQTDTLAGFPITIAESVQTDQFGPPNSVTGVNQREEFPDSDMINPYDAQANSTVHENILDDEYIAYLEAMDSTLYNTISYTHDIEMNVITMLENGTYQQVDINNDFSFFGSSSVFNELPSNQEFVLSQYDLLDGEYPTNANEVVLVIDNRNQLDVDILEALGLDIEEYTFNDFLGKQFKVIPNNVYYTEVASVYVPNSNLQDMYNNTESVTLTITGILRVNKDATSEILGSGIAYTVDLTNYMQAKALSSDIVQAQKANPDTNILTGTAFNQFVTYDSVLKSIGGTTTPSGVEIYPTTYESKDVIKDYLDAYNDGKDEVDQVIYTDFAEVFSDTISKMINTITIILTAFAGISLVVSSIMIGIITYVSVIERTKEIGIMRSLGARKKDISRIFNAETLLIGLSSGLLGVLVYYLLQGPINIVINNLAEIEGFAALPIYYALFLVALSSILTLVAGLIPSRIAAKKDPVIALRTE
jgi:putative ABC transport system permease protein